MTTTQDTGTRTGTDISGDTSDDGKKERHLYCSTCQPADADHNISLCGKKRSPRRKRDWPALFFLGCGRCRELRWPHVRLHADKVL